MPANRGHRPRLQLQLRALARVIVKFYLASPKATHYPPAMALSKISNLRFGHSSQNPQFRRMCDEVLGLDRKCRCNLCSEGRQMFAFRHTELAPSLGSQFSRRFSWVAGNGGGCFDLRFNFSRKARCAFRPAVVPLA